MNIGESKDKYNMDGHKLSYHLDRVRDFMDNKRIFPLHIDLGITTGCNLACHFCYGIIQNRAGYGTENMSKMTFMPEGALVRLIEDSKRLGIRSIAFIGEGENTLNPALYTGLAKAKEVDLDVGIATNGIKIPYEKMDLMLDSLKWIRINISAATPDSYARVHDPKNEVRGKRLYNSVIENSINLVELKNKKERGSTIGFQMVITDRNMDQIVPLAKLGKEIGIDYSVFKSCSDTPEGDLGAPYQEYLKLEQTFKDAEKFSDDKYSVIIKRQKLGNLGKKDYKTCFGTEFILGISGNGNVFPCGHWFDIRKDEFLLGNIIDQSLEEVVKSERYLQVQKGKVKCVKMDQCETNCRQHYINQTLYDLKTGKISVEDLVPKEGQIIPEHVNFV